MDVLQSGGNMNPNYSEYATVAYPPPRLCCEGRSPASAKVKGFNFIADYKKIPEAMGNREKNLLRSGIGGRLKESRSLMLQLPDTKTI